MWGENKYRKEQDECFSVPYTFLEWWIPFTFKLRIVLLSWMWAKVLHSEVEGHESRFPQERLVCTQNLPFPFPPQLRWRLCKRVHKDGTQTCRCFLCKNGTCQQLIGARYFPGKKSFSVICGRYFPSMSLCCFLKPCILPLSWTVVPSLSFT